MMTPLIRTAKLDDAEPISRLVVRTLQETNARDYPPYVIAAIVPNFSPERIATLLTEREVLVATLDGDIIGTGSLKNSAVRTVFVAPEYQQRGIGRALMRELEALARERGLTHLVVPSSITAEGFYARLGFVAIRDEYNGAERTIIMKRTLEPCSRQNSG